MSDSENKKRVFISYARADDPPDQPFVRRLYEDLTQAGFTVWFDRESLLSRGKTFHQEIRDAIRTEVDRIVYVGGLNAALSPYVREDWETGLAFDHVVVTPILRQGDYDTSVPGELTLLHCEDFRNDAVYPEALAKLVDGFPPRESATASDSVAGDWHGLASGRSAILRRETTSFLLATWQADADPDVPCLFPDGTMVVTQENGQVCFLHLHHGNRRISIAETEELLRSEGEV